MIQFNPMHKPVRHNLVDECIRCLRLQLEAGEWATGLPGERILAQSLEVSRDTIRMTLARLEQDGIISTAQPGTKRTILIRRKQKTSSSNDPLRIGFLSPRRLEQMPQPMLLEVDHLRRSLGQDGASLEWFSPSWFDLKNPAKHLEKLIKEASCNAWVLYRATDSIQHWFAASDIPCLVRGYPNIQDQLPHLDVDWQATARHAATRLWRHGHRRAAILIPPDHLRGVQAAIRGANSLDDSEFHLDQIQENGTPDGVCAAIARAINRFNPPTAIITPRARQAATAITWLGSQGFRIPNDFAIISLAHEPFMDSLVPEISGYRVNHETVSKLVIRRVKSLLAGPSSRPLNAWITPDVIQGKTLGDFTKKTS